MCWVFFSFLLNIQKLPQGKSFCSCSKAFVQGMIDNCFKTVFYLFGRNFGENDQKLKAAQQNYNYLFSGY
jgi:hypothetical protein